VRDAGDTPVEMATSPFGPLRPVNIGGLS
jgi:hypothetical protein